MQEKLTTIGDIISFLYKHFFDDFVCLMLKARILQIVTPDNVNMLGLALMRFSCLDFVETLEINLYFRVIVCCLY